MPDGKIIIIIPTYNEAGNIERLIPYIKSLYPDIDILVVDDNSPDGTGDIAAGFSRCLPGVNVLRRRKKEGLGRAYSDGFLYVLAHPNIYDYIMEMDADFSHDPADIRRIISFEGNADVCIGSRYIPGGRIPSWGIYRRMVSAGANILVRVCLGYDIKDWTGGFRCFKRSAITAISIEGVLSRGYLFQIEVLHRCLLKGLKVVEVPITFTERCIGRTKFGASEVREAFFGLARLTMERFRRNAIK